MKHRRTNQTIDGSPELALLVFAILAAFAYVVL